MLCDQGGEGGREEGGGRGGGGWDYTPRKVVLFELLDELRGDWPVVEIRQACTI